MPTWCDKDPACWEAIVRYWRSDACYQEKNERRGRRLNNAGVAHHQGNRSLPQFMDAWVCFCSSIYCSAQSIYL